MPDETIRCENPPCDRRPPTPLIDRMSMTSTVCQPGNIRGPSFHVVKDDGSPRGHDSSRSIKIDLTSRTVTDRKTSAVSENIAPPVTSCHLQYPSACNAKRLQADRAMPGSPSVYFLRGGKMHGHVARWKSNRLLRRSACEGLNIYEAGGWGMEK